MNHKGADFLTRPRPLAPVGGGRLVYRMPDIEPLLIGKTVALIGDGPSKRRYIFDPYNVVTLAINKAALCYPCAMAVVSETHYDEIMVQYPPWVPVIYIGSVDIRRHNIGPGLWTAICALNWLSSIAGKIYMQGFDLSSDNYVNQIVKFRAIQNKTDTPIINTGRGRLDVFPFGEPDVKDIC